MTPKRVCVFCGSNPGADPAFAEAATSLGTTMAARGIGVVYGGGAVGLMGRLAEAALEAGGEVDGVITTFLNRREIANPRCTRLHVVESMHERKAMMADLADAFVALPGGIGTLEEWFEALTWTQLGLHDKPVALLDVNRYWDPLLAMLDGAVVHGFMADEVRASVLVGHHPATLLDDLDRWVRPPLARWTDVPPDDAPDPR